MVLLGMAWTLFLGRHQASDPGISSTGRAGLGFCAVRQKVHIGANYFRVGDGLRQTTEMTAQIQAIGGLCLVAMQNFLRPMRFGHFSNRGSLPILLNTKF
jgi:hypothetical protein